MLANAGIPKPSSLGPTKEILEGGGSSVCGVVLPQTSTLALILCCLHWPGLSDCIFLKDLLRAKHT